jgi:peroxiredoxin (alkyl hydroperoxide reductase subunit C)
MCDKKASFAAIQPTMKAPYWEGTAVINGEFKKIKSTDYEGKYLVLFFYPLDFTFVCPTEIIAFSDRIEEFKKIKTEVRESKYSSRFATAPFVHSAAVAVFAR